MDANDKLVDRLTIRGIVMYWFNANIRYAVDHYLDMVDQDVAAHIEAGHVDKPMGYMRGKAEIYVSKKSFLRIISLT